MTEPIAFYAASSADPDRADHLRITVELAPGNDEPTTLGGFLHASNVPLVLRELDQMWKGAGAQAVASAVFTSLYSEEAFAMLRENGTAHMILAGALWVACRNGDIGIDVEKGMREALNADGQAHVLVSYSDAAGGQLRVKLVPVQPTH